MYNYFFFSVQSGGGGDIIRAGEEESEDTVSADSDGGIGGDDDDDDDDNDDDIIAEDASVDTADAADENINDDDDDDDDNDVDNSRRRDESQASNNYNYILLRTENFRKFKRFGVIGREATFEIRAIPPSEDVIAWLEGAFREIHRYAIDFSEPADYVGVWFDSPSLTNGAAGLSFRPARDLTHESIWTLVSSLAQSNGGMDIAANFVIHVCTVHPQAGRGRPLDAVRVAKRSILSLTNPDNLCFPRSLIIARVYHERGNIRTGELHERWNAVRRQNSVLQRQWARELVQRVGIAIPEEGCGIEEIERFQRYLAADGIAIVVYNANSFGRGGKPIYDGNVLLASLGRESLMRLNILYYEDSRHYEPILNLRAAAGSREYCIPCNLGYRGDRGVHRCVHKCSRCRHVPPCEIEGVEMIRCEQCRRMFYGRDCLERHRAEKSYDGRAMSVCKALQFCEDCGRLYRSTNKQRHECGVIYCKICNSRREINHLCYMRPLARKKAQSRKVENEGKGGKTRKNAIFVFYDFETRQDETLEGTASVKIHVPTLCVAQQICVSCADEDDMTLLCRWCGVREFIFRDDPVKQFVDFVTRPIKCFKQIICIAHNARAFDAQFILRYIVEKRVDMEPQVILNGTKIIALTVGRTKFIDSVNYMPMRLSVLPKAFGLRDDTEKGFFPHLFNTIANQSYVGPLPSVDYYSTNSMSKDERERFLSWYAEQSRENTVFDFQREIVRYCRNDVDILRRACKAFRKIFLERGNVCPFEECTTIASTCMRVFRKNFLRAEEIGVIPRGGYRLADAQSRKALQWLVWKERELGHPIIHTGHGREHRLAEVGGIPVDGYYESANGERHVLQFHGCFWHGCPTCFRTERDKRLNAGRKEKNPDKNGNDNDDDDDNHDTLNSRYERTLAMSWRLRKRGYTVTEKWECAHDRDMRENADIREYVKKHPLIENEPLDPRDAFFGGRTGNIAIHREVSGTEKIRYVDVCSLYPYVLKTGVFPIGHPKILVGEEECASLIGTAPGFDFSTVEGLVRCRVLPPRNLFHPVLPYRVRGKLLFALCRSCCEVFSQAPCSHENPHDRELTGTWISCELRKAIEKGYLVTAVSEIWQYEVTRYDRATRQGGLFAEYINCFLKLKQEASGWPSECVDEESKARYLRQYEDVEGIVLNRENITRNPGLRSVAKLCLNSFWGKFGQRTNLPTTEVIKAPERLVTLLASPEHEVTDILPVNDDVIYASWRLRSEAVVPSPIANVVIAAYTTAQARLTLYEYLERLGERVLYYDTDSCIYVSSGEHDDDEYEPRTGNFLGDMTDELESYGRGSYIESFVSGGPKFYAYIVRTPDESTREVCKVKGITLNSTSSRIVNFTTIREMVTRGEREEEKNIPIQLRFRAIRRTAFHEVVTRDETKTCTPVLVKRRFIDERRSVPYGYVE